MSEVEQYAWVKNDEWNVREGHFKSALVFNGRYSTPYPAVTNDTGKPQPSIIYQERRRHAVEQKLAHSEAVVVPAPFGIVRLIENEYYDLDQPLIYRSAGAEILSVGTVSDYWRPSDEAIPPRFSEDSLGSRQAQSFPSLPTWVTDFYNDPREKAPRSSLRRMLSELRALLSIHDVQAINLVLSNVDWQRLPPEIVMGLVRASAVAQERLPSWRSATVKASTELRRRGLPAEHIMVGLLEGTDDGPDTRSA